MIVPEMIAIDKLLRLCFSRTSVKCASASICGRDKPMVVWVAGMNTETCHWNPWEFLDTGSVNLSYGVLILNQPIILQQEYLISLWNRASVRVTVDGGANRWHAFTTAEKCSMCALPDMLTGDMDSVSQEVLEHYQSQGVEVICTLDQNETDFTKALRQISLYRKRRHTKLEAVVAVVETSGRLDQIVGNINTLYKAEELFEGTSVPIFLLGSNSLTWLLAAGSHSIAVPQRLAQSHTWCSLMPFGAPACVSTSGLKWDLDNKKMEFGNLVSTSNTYSGDSTVTVSTDSYLVWSMGLGYRDDDDP